MSFWPYLGQVNEMPETVYLLSHHTLREMSIRDRTIWNGSQPLWPNAFTTVSVNPAAISDGITYTADLWSYAAANAGDLKCFRYRNDATSSVETYQALVMVYCEGFYLLNDTQANTMAFANLGSLPADFNEALSADVSYKTTGLNNYATLTTAQQYVASNSKPGILWLNDDDLRNATASTLIAVALVPSGIFQLSSYYCCSVDSRQGGVTLQTTRNSPKLVTGPPSGFDSTGTYNPSWPRLYPSAQWAEYVNPELTQWNTSGGPSTSPFAELIRAAGMWNSTQFSMPYNAEFIVESALASLLANGIGRASYNILMAGTLRGQAAPSDLWSGGEWPDEFLP